MVVPMIHPSFGRATIKDAGTLAQFVEFASEGLALYLWAKIAGAGNDPGTSAARVSAPKRVAYPITTQL